VSEWLNQDPGEPFLDSLASVIQAILDEHLQEWTKETPSIFKLYTAWCLARALTHDDAVEIFRTQSPAIIRDNSHYRSIAVSFVPPPDEYARLPRENRFAIARALEYHQEGYVRAIWDDRGEMANRDGAYMGLVRRLLAVESDPQIHAMLGKMGPCTAWGRGALSGTETW
jgi:hypothetical protein